MKKFSVEEFLANPEKKVVMKGGTPVRIICTDKKTNGDKQAVLGLVMLPAGYESIIEIDNPSSVLFFTDEEEPMTEFEKRISGYLQAHGLLDCGAADRIARKSSKDLLELTRKEITEGLVWISPDELNRQLDQARNMGKAEAMKDLPRWKKRDDFDYPTQFCGVVISGGQTTTLPVVIADGYEIPIPELLNKLPKEE